MTQTELHNQIYTAAETLANKHGFIMTDSSTKQNFLLGELIPNPDNLLQEVKWTDGENQIEFRHRFTNVCMSIKFKGVFAEAEYGLIEETNKPCLCETQTIGGRAGLMLLDQILNLVKIEG